MLSASDARQNVDARLLLSDLVDRGIRVTVRAGRLDVRPASLLTPGDVTAIKGNRSDLLILTLACSDDVLDRLLDMRAGRLGRAVVLLPGRCHVCGAALPDDRPHGRCGPCALAARLYAGAPLTTDVLGLYPADVRGHQLVPQPAGGALPFDLTVPA